MTIKASKTSVTGTLSILRVGATEESLAKEWTHAVIAYLKGVANSAVLPISNKYFDASVALRPLDVSDLAADDDKKSGGGQEDGIVLIFEDDSSHKSFQSLANLHAKAESNQQNGDLLRLCIGVVNKEASGTTMTAKEREDEYARRVLWCLDHGYEYVEKVDLTEPNVGHEAREKEGFARVIEAIQGTVWSTAKMHPKRKVALQQSYQQAKDETTKVDDNDDDNKNAYEPPPTTLPLTTTTTDNNDNDKEREEKARQALLQQDGVEQSNDEYIDGKPPNDEEERRKEQQADKIMADMEGALKEANRIRDMSKAGALSDDERKQRAGDAATLIMDLMNKMGAVDGESSDDNNNAKDENEEEEKGETKEEGKEE